MLVHYFLQDKAIAFKIFELGLKKFSDEPTYVLAYLDHLSHLNGECLAHITSCLVNRIVFTLFLCIEDNNTRVLFEKVLTTMPTDRTK